MHFHILWLSITQLQIRQSERPRAYLYLLQSVLQFGIQFTVETKKKLTIIFNFLYHKKKNSSISYYIYIFNRLENIAEVVELVLHKKGGEKNTFNIFNDICEIKTASSGGKNFSEGIQLISNYSFKC